MALPSVWWINKAADAFSWIAPLAAAVLSFTLFITNVFTLVIMAGLDAVVMAFEAIDLSMLGGAQFSVINGIGYVNAVIPLTEMLAVLLGYYTAWITVIAIRWVKSFIPTISN